MFSKHAILLYYADVLKSVKKAISFACLPRR